MRLTVLLGGVSAERDVSLSSGLRMAVGLREAGHQVTCFDPAFGVLSESTEQALLAAGVGSAPPALAELAELRHRTLSADWLGHPAVREAECVVIGLHGGQGEDGTVQAALDLVGVPYSGSGHIASALAMDKHLSKVVLRHAGVPTADWLMAPPLTAPALDPAVVAEQIGWPAVVKPSRQGSTVGLSIVREAAALQPAIEEAYKHDDAVMVERFVAGRELTVGVLGDLVLPPIEIEAVKELYDYECKYTPGMAREFVPELPAETLERLRAYSRQAFDACGLAGYGRVDFRMDRDGGLWCLELNTLPGMTPTSLIPQAAAAAGLLFPALCDRIVQLALASSRRG
jgi:D-alanine-D-alanine ligase